jgi:carbon-monoxide dehydrogenase medium subunit
VIAPFEYHAPTSLDEALQLLERHGDDAHVIAGGTSLVLLMKQGLVRPAHVIGIRGVPDLAGISRADDGSLVIGACATHRGVERSPEIRAALPALADTFARIATVRIRNQGTVGGNLAHADPAQDPPPALLALDAELHLASARGKRTVPIDGFFTDVFETILGPGELIRSVRIPPVPAGARFAYVKFLPRTADDYATVSVAAVIARDVHGRCSHARVALGAAGPVPFRASAAEAALIDKPLTSAAIDDAAELAAGQAEPFDDVRGSAAYKKEMARVITRRALHAAASLDH